MLCLKDSKFHTSHVLQIWHQRRFCSVWFHMFCDCDIERKRLLLERMILIVALCQQQKRTFISRDFCNEETLTSHHKMNN